MEKRHSSLKSDVLLFGEGLAVSREAAHETEADGSAPPAGLVAHRVVLKASSVLQLELLPSMGQLLELGPGEPRLSQDGQESANPGFTVVRDRNRHCCSLVSLLHQNMAPPSPHSDKPVPLEDLANLGSREPP